MPSWLKSKFLLNVLALLGVTAHYLVDHQMVTKYLPWEGLAIVLCDTIAGMVSTGKIAKLEKQVDNLAKQLLNK